MMKQLDTKGVIVNKTPNINKLASVGEMGLFGNVWVRSHYLHKAGFTNGGGHKHDFDHVTLLAVGSVLVEVEGFEPKEFVAPTFITIDKNHQHKFTALTDGVVYYCVFAVRDTKGEVIVDQDNLIDLSVPKKFN
jgi:hypothetical protein